MTLEEYERKLDAALEELDWRDPRSKDSDAHKVLAAASADKSLSLEDSITLAQNNAIDFTHACVTIALNEKFSIGKDRQKKVNAMRDEVNGKVLEIMTRPASRKHEPLRKAEAWMHSQLPEGTAWELHIPEAKGRPKKSREWQMKMAIDNAATLEWRVCAIACAEVLGFGAERLNRLHEEVLANYRQLNQWVLEEGVDVAMEWFRRAASSAYKTNVEVLDKPDREEIRNYKMHTEQAMREMRARQVRDEVRRMCAPKALPLAPNEVERRIQTVLMYGTMDSWQRRRTR